MITLAEREGFTCSRIAPFYGLGEAPLVKYYLDCDSLPEVERKIRSAKLIIFEEEFGDSHPYPESVRERFTKEYGTDALSVEQKLHWMERCRPILSFLQRTDLVWCSSKSLSGGKYSPLAENMGGDNNIESNEGFANLCQIASGSPAYLKWVREVAKALDCGYSLEAQGRSVRPQYLGQHHLAKN